MFAMTVKVWTHVDSTPRGSVPRVHPGALAVLHPEIFERKDAPLAVDGPTLLFLLPHTAPGWSVGGVCG